MQKLRRPNQLAAGMLKGHFIKFFEQYPELIVTSVKLAYNDAISYDSSSKIGGPHANMNLRKVRNYAASKPFVGTIETLRGNLYLSDSMFSKLSLADYIQLTAYYGILEAEGPFITERYRFGRKDIKDDSQSHSEESIPQPEKGLKAYLQHHSRLGFTPEETAALASIYAFGVVKDPEHFSQEPKINNYYYQQILTSSPSKGHIQLPLDKLLLEDEEIKRFVEKFAQDNKEFKRAFGDAFIKLSELGYTDNELQEVDMFLVDHPFKNFLV